METVRFDTNGLIPAVVQDAETGDVLMLAFMNNEALRLTQSTGTAHYWSRSRGKLWRKGETSGNQQFVEEIRINCEQNSLLLRVRQTGAVCHDGYDTCYYRELESDGTLTILREQAFDPRTVYSAPEPVIGADSLATATRLQFGAYCYLRDHDLSSVSGTSRRLHEPGEDLTGRIADELDELAGVLEGSHRHSDLMSDVCLEASQIIYWVMIEVIRAGDDWTELRPDRALATADDEVSAATGARLLRAGASRWRSSANSAGRDLAGAHATLALVAQACRAVGLDPLKAVESDLVALRGRDYLNPYFGSES